MRTIQYLSPTSVSLWEQDKQEFYLRYLAENRPPRFPQNQPMSIGSAFDAYAKAYLHENLFGKGNDPRFQLEALFEAQVEPQNRDWAFTHGAYVFDCYKQSGALADLMTELKTAQGEPRFEFEVRGAVHGYREGQFKSLANVVLLGKPDVTFTNAAGAHVIHDFKVNGYCSKSPPSPMQGYLKLRTAGKTNHGQHKSCQPMMVNGMMINVATYLENLNKDWAQQLAFYAWLCGEPVGSNFIVSIDQLVCDANKGALPAIRTALHRMTVGEKFQNERFGQACDLWEIVQSDHIFRDMSLADSQARCKILDGYSEAIKGDGSVEDQWFAATCRG